MSINESYLFLAFGKSYISDCLDFVETKNRFNDKRSVNIIVCPEDYDFAVSLNVFNIVHTYDIRSHELFNLCKTNFEKYCLLPRLELYKFLDTEYTIVLDTDILYSFSADKVWDFFINLNQDFIMIGSGHNPHWHWGEWGKICQKNNIDCLETHGGLFFLKKTESIINIFNTARYCFENYDSLGMHRKYQDGAVDEPCFAYAFAKNNIKPINFSSFPIMTFNLSYQDEIPTKKLTETMQQTTMDDFIPFIHMFEKNQSYNFLAIKKKILK
jgi:hypothetical protein